MIQSLVFAKLKFDIILNEVRALSERSAALCLLAAGYRNLAAVLYPICKKTQKGHTFNEQLHLERETDLVQLKFLCKM